MAQHSCGPLIAVGVIFDGDDTLWSTEQLYDDARAEARVIVQNSGLNGATWEELERRIDVENVANLGYGIERFPASCVQAYEILCRRKAQIPDPKIAERIRQAARSVFERDPPVVPGAGETLRILRESGARLALLTKGDHELQSRRIRRSGLSGYFDVIRIVPKKSPAIIRDVVAALCVDVQSAWMVGNSPGSDLVPAMKAGLHTVHIPAHVWEYERAQDQSAAGGFIRASKLADLPWIVTK